MIGKTLNYISHHAIAILALVCSLLALAGASYAAIAIPKNSVGNAQIKQGAVAPPKFSKEIGGYVRAYAVVSATGKLVYSSPKAKLNSWGDSTTGGPSFGTISWESTAPAHRCAAFATAQNGSTPTPITAVVEPNLRGVTGTHVAVRFDGAVSVAVEVVC
jgi:hypothetical protein